MAVTENPLIASIRAALAQVIDPELRRPITELGMVGSIELDADQRATVTILLTTATCPLRGQIDDLVSQAVATVPGVTGVDVVLDVMNDAQRQAVREQLRGGAPERTIAWADPASPTRVIAVASGKGGVGKSSVTVNLACALADQGQRVGLIDADIYGHSVPDLLGIPEGEGPTNVEGVDLMLPVEIHGIKVMSIGMMKPSRDQVVAWRGPVVDRALTQFMTDVWWAELDYVLIDLPPGTGDVAMGIGQKLPNAEVIVVTTPQAAAVEVAERAGTLAAMLNQPVLGVVENMSYLVTTCPHCGESQQVNVFGRGGGANLAASLTTRLGYDVPLLAEIPLEPEFRVAGDLGKPPVLLDRARPAAAAIIGLAERIAVRRP